VLKLFLPRLGQTMEEALLESWVVSPGVPFAIGEVLYEVETEKVTAGVEATVAGSIVRALAADGDRLEVGALLAVIAEPGEAPTEEQIDAFLAGDEVVPQVPAAATAADPAPEVTASPTPGGSTEPVRAMPKTRALARSLDVDIAAVAVASPGALVTEDQVRAVAASSAEPVRPVVSAAQEFTRPPATEPPPVTPSAAIPAVAPSVPLPDGIEIRERRRLSGIHRRMADVTSRTWTTVPQFSQSVDVDASGWSRRRDELRTLTAMEVGYTDVILSMMVRAVQEVPEVNSSYAGEELVIYRDVNISIAVDSPQGLQVPVLHRMQDLSDAGRARLLRDRTAKAREGTLGLDDVKGGTITMSNLGRYGIEGGMPMLTTPQAAIVFVGAIVPRVVPVADGIGVRPICTIVTAFDHRAVDGATAARFTSTLRRLLQEDPR
jgi:pyruvate dehydrogenase E2 component (dihydrolipoamide acetyltransferase)